MKSYSVAIPEIKFFCGNDSLTQLTKQLGKYSRVFVLATRSVAANDKLMQLIRDALGEKLVCVCNQALPRSPLDAVQKCADELRKSEADAIVAIGGGSTFVTARAADIFATEEGDPHILCTHKDETGKTVSPKLTNKKLPIFSIPTTPSCSAVKCGAAVLDEKLNLRLQLFDPKLRTKAVFVHPDFISSTPEDIFMNAAANTLACTVDAILSNVTDPYAEALLEKSLRMTYEVFGKSESICTEEARTALVMASNLTGLGSDKTGFGLILSIGHAVNEYFPAKDGHINMAVLPYCLRYNKDASGMKELAGALGLSFDSNPEEAVIMAFAPLLKALGFENRLSDLKLDAEYMEKFAEGTMHDFFIRYNPVPVTKESALDIIKRSW